MVLTLRDIYECSETHFWDELFFDEAYNRALYRDGLGFSEMDILGDEVEPNGERRRRMRVKPKLDAPRAVRRLIGDALTYVEEGVFDPHSRRWDTRVVTSRLADRVKIGISVRCEPRGPDRCERVADFDFDVRVLGLGRVFEQFIAHTMRENYGKAARFSNAWLRQCVISKH